jgi:hypothetical protein
MGAVPGGGRDRAKSKLEGAFTATGVSANFSPDIAHDFNISLWGTFTATVAVERSFDAGVTWLPVTYADSPATALSYTAGASFSWPEPEDGVQYRLNCTWASGTVNYRLSQ